MKKTHEKSALLKAFTDYENSLAAQDKLIERFRETISGSVQSELSDLPFPVVIFNGDGRATAASLLFCCLTGIKAENIPAYNYSIIGLVTTKNWGIFDALEDAVSGKSRFIKDLKEPLCMFSSEWHDKRIPQYTKALFFPLPDTEDGGKRGAAVFLK